MGNVNASLHLQGVPANIREFQQVSRARWIKWINPDETYPLFDGQPWGFSHWLIRFHVPDHIEWAEMARGVQGAGEFFDRNAPLWAKRQLWLLRPEVEEVVFTTGNEPHPPEDPQFLKQLNLFLLELKELCRPYDFKLAGPNFSVGWPQVHHVKHIAEGCSVLDWICLHEYDWPDPWTTPENWRIGRVERFYNKMVELGYSLDSLPRCLVGEGILDGNVLNKAPDKGWRHLYGDNPQAYVDRVRWVRDLYANMDPQVVEAFFLFTVKGGGWDSYNHDDETIMRIAKLGSGEPPPPPPPPPPPGGDMKIRYYLKGEKVNEAEFEAVFGNGYQPYKAVGDGSNDDFPDILKAQIHEMHQVDNMALECDLRMLDGSVPEHIEQYEFVTWIHGNDYRADFKVIEGKAVAEWIMGHDGWWYNPEDGSAGAGICFVGRKDGTLHSEQVRGVGWCSVAGYGSHAHANLVFTIEPSGGPPPPPPPPPPDTYTITTEVDPPGVGRVEPESMTGIEHEQEATFAATVIDESYVFQRWQDQLGNRNLSNPVTFNVTASIVLTAVFKKKDAPPPPPPPPPPPGPTPEDIEAAKVKIVGIVELSRGAWEDLGSTFTELLAALGWEGQANVNG